MKRKKGFTLVEVLVVVVILGILVGVVVGSVNLYVKKGKDTYNSKMDDQSVLSAKNFFIDNSEELKEGFISFSELASKGYLSKDFIDAYGNDCMENSYVTIKTIDNSKPLTLSNAEYHACIKCDNGGYTNISADNKDCDIDVKDEKIEENEEVISKTLTINVIGGTIDSDTSKSYSIENNTSYTVSNITPDENFAYDNVTCNNSANGTYNNNKLSVSNITTDTVCTITFKTTITGTPTITLNVLNESDSSATLSGEKSRTIEKGVSSTFTVNVPAPSDRYKISKDITCDNEGVTTQKNYNWKAEVNNSTRQDSFTITNNSVQNDTAVNCTVTYKTRWIGVETKSYTQGSTITYAGKTWTVVSDSDNSVKLALNSVASGSANLPYTSASNWLDTTWLNNTITGTLKTTLQTDRNNNGLLPISGNYFNTDSGISTNLTSYNYYVSSNKFYNAVKRNHYKLTKTAFINESYKKNADVSTTIYNTGYSTDYTTPVGIYTFTSGKYYIDSSNALVFKNAGTPTSTALSNSHYTSRYMTYKIKKSISSTTECEECECVSTGKSGDERICYIRDKNYRTATVSTDGTTVSYVAQKFTESYGYMGSGNKVIKDTKYMKFYLCGGSSHGKLLTLSYKSTSKYTWTSPAGNTYNPSYSNTNVFRIAGNAITYCPLSGNLDSYSGCTPKKVGVPHIRTYRADTSSACKSNVKKYTLQNLVNKIYYRPQLEVRKR